VNRQSTHLLEKHLITLNIITMVKKSTNEIKNDNGMIVEFTTVSSYMAALEFKEAENKTLSSYMLEHFKSFLDYIKKDYKGFEGDAEYNMYLHKSQLKFTPLDYLRLKYLQHDTSARNKIGNFIASWNPNDGSEADIIQMIAKEVARHAEKYIDQMEIVDLCYYINFKLEEKED